MEVHGWKQSVSGELCWGIEIEAVLRFSSH